MDQYRIAAEIKVYELRLLDQLIDWLSDKLPRLGEPNWWDVLVYDNLTDLQQEDVRKNNITSLEGLDLASLLQVVLRNWWLLKDKYPLYKKDKDNVYAMKEVRNDWAHVKKIIITKQKAVKDIQLYIDVVQLFGASSKDTSDMESFLLAVENDEDYVTPKIQTTTVSSAPTVEPVVEVIDGFEVGMQVELVSDPSKIGVVMKTDNGKYTVFMENAQKVFFKEQLKLHIPEIVEDRVPLSRVRCALTAHQILNPGSSNLYSLNAARIDFVPYQFRPALKMIKSDSPRLLVADDVGVGKTIEAGLILKEMEARSNTDSVLIICPRPLVAERKWQLEMKRFDEDFTQLNGSDLQRCIDETDRDGEWPDRDKKTIIPYSLFSEDMLYGTRSTSTKKYKKKGLLELDPPPHFDLVIVDEAHAIRNANTYSYRAVEFLTRNADAVVFLTATPLQNSNKDLYTLLNVLRPDIVLDNDTFTTMSEPNAYINSLLRIVRNQKEGWQEEAKEEISNILGTSWGRSVTQHNPNFGKIFDLLDKESITREEKVEALGWIESLHSFNTMLTRTRRKDIGDFCIRHTQTVNVPLTDKQREIYEAVLSFEERALTMLHGDRSVYFMMCTIMRQAASCIYGLVPFLDDLIRKRLDQISGDGEFIDFEGDDYNLSIDEKKSLQELADSIRELAKDLPEEDYKLEKLYEIIENKQKEENNRIILFSSFRHTLSYIREHLIKKGYRVAQVDGSVEDEERFKIRQRFLMDRDEENAIDILLFSEVGCEGLDYQFCDSMINYDLPWNPMRIEQRIGRIDRRGQVSETVRIYNMITEGTIDAVIHDRCLSKIGIFERCIGDCSEILGQISNNIFKIMFDPSLTPEDRELKIEQMADNEISKVQELNRLEQEERTLYGFDLSSYIQNKDVQDAENTWISPETISNLVDAFLVDYLGDGEYIRSNKETEIKNMHLIQDKRQMLLENLEEMAFTNTTAASKLWNAYLKSTKQNLRITYDSDCAKENRDVTFLTQMHPLVLQAAQYEGQKLPCEIGIQVSDVALPAGDYEFLIYAWRFVGFRPDIRLVAVSEDKNVEGSILDIIQYALDYDFDSSNHEAKWDALENLHYEKWQNAKESYVEDVKEDCEYRVGQLRQTTTKREIIINGQIENAKDEKIIRMRTSQLLKLRNDYEQQKKNLEAAIQKADIHTEPLIKGVLHVN